MSNLDQYRNDEPHTATYPYINHGSEQNQVSPKFHRPTQLDVLRYRYHHGANLGGIFVLEKWLYGDMFDSVERGESELDAVTTYAHIIYSQYRANKGLKFNQEIWC